MKKHSSLVDRALGFEKAGIFGDLEDIPPADKIGNHLAGSKKDFARIIKVSGILAKKLVPSFKAQ